VGFFFQNCDSDELYTIFRGASLCLTCDLEKTVPDFDTRHPFLLE
jgi:hypothetical protein